MYGTSDLDVPHRLAVGFEVHPFGGMSVAGRYRFSSGMPFTPGFRDGVDVNGDGSGRNDPAFIVSGLGNETCLRDQVGQFAERNSCRGPSLHNMDIRINLNLLRIAGQQFQLMIDGLNILDGEIADPDRAVYLIDPNAPLDTSVPGQTAIPLVVNDNFGEPLIRRSTGRLLRIGLRLGY